MATTILHAIERTEKPSAVRREGFIPGVIYGSGLTNGIAVKFDASELQKELRIKGKSLKMSIQLGKEKKDVIVKEIQREPLSGSIQHVDLQVITGDEKVKMAIPVIVLGREEIENRGLILQASSGVIEMSGLLHLLPEAVTIDMTGKEVGDAIRVGDLQLSSEISIHNSPDETLAVISAPRMVEPEVDEDATPAVEE